MTQPADKDEHGSLPGLPPLPGLEWCIGLPLNHKEAWDLACYKSSNSNMARCYIALSYAARNTAPLPECGTLEFWKNEAGRFEESNRQAQEAIADLREELRVARSTSGEYPQHVEEVYLAVRIAAEGSDWKRDSGESLAAWIDRKRSVLSAIQERKL